MLTPSDDERPPQPEMSEPIATEAATNPNRVPTASENTLERLRGERRAPATEIAYAG